MDLVIGDVININGDLACIIAQPQDMQYLAMTTTQLLWITVDDEVITVANQVTLAYIQASLSELMATVVGHIEIN